MSIKTNTADLQALLEVANNLPVAENLDSEISDQDDLIAKITAALEGKSAGGEGGIVEPPFTVKFNGVPTSYNYVLYNQDFYNHSKAGSSGIGGAMLCIFTEGIHSVSNITASAGYLINITNLSSNSLGSGGFVYVLLRDVPDGIVEVVVNVTAGFVGPT